MGRMADAEESRLAAAATAVYSAVPEDFLPERSRRVAAAKAAGDTAAAKEIGRLRKPSVSAWALNLLAHQGDPVLGRLSGLGELMRSATSRLDVAELASHRPARDRLLGDLVEAAAAAVGAAGRTLSAVGREEVRGTGIAALADAAAQRALESGTLTRALSYSGFGEVDVADAVAVTSTGRVLAVVRGGRGEDEPEPEPVEPAVPAEDPAEGVRREREAVLAAATVALTAAREALAGADDDLEGARERREAAERQLEKAEAAESRATARLAAARRAVREAERAERDAHAALDRT